jgi:hypothetical protein
MCPVCPSNDCKRARTLAEHLYNVHHHEPEDAEAYVATLTDGASS